MKARADVEIQDLSPQQAEALIACVRRCYGETYPDADFSDAAALRRVLESGRLHSKVAVAPDGRILGHLGTRLLAPGDCVAETVGGIVDPDARGRGLLRALGAEMVKVYRELSLAGIRLFATGAHLRTQRQILSASGRATGVLLGHVPAGTDYRGIGHDFGAARIGAVVFYQPMGPAPALEVFVPEPYRDWLRGLHARTGLERRVRPDPGAALPRGSRQADERRGVTWLRFGRLADAATVPAERLLAEASAGAEGLTYADLPLCEAGMAPLTERLRALGFHFGALLPGSERTETLRLQRLPDRLVAPERIAVGSEEVAALREAVLADRRAVLSQPGEVGDPAGP